MKPNNFNHTKVLMPCTNKQSILGIQYSSIHLVERISIKHMLSTWGSKKGLNKDFENPNMASIREAT